MAYTKKAIQIKLHSIRSFLFRYAQIIWSSLFLRILTALLFIIVLVWVFFLFAPKSAYVSIDGYISSIDNVATTELLATPNSYGPEKPLSSYSVKSTQGITIISDHSVLVDDQFQSKNISIAANGSFSIIVDESYYHTYSSTRPVNRDTHLTVDGANFFVEEQNGCEIKGWNTVRLESYSVDKDIFSIYDGDKFLYSSAQVRIEIIDPDEKTMFSHPHPGGQGFSDTLRLTGPTSISFYNSYANGRFSLVMYNIKQLSFSFTGDVDLYYTSQQNRTSVKNQPPEF